MGDNERMTPGEQVGEAAIAGVVDRPRLYSILGSDLVRVCVVQGPSGAGKTTLLRSWVQRRGERETVAWVSLGEGIATRQVFWQHVVASAERLGEMSKETADEVRRQLSASVDPVRIASAVLAATGPVVLILDAYEHVGDVTTAIDDDLGRLLVAVPTLRVMVSTRGRTALTDLALPEGVARVISLSDLTLTVDEARQLITEQAGIDDGRLARSVIDATRGFALTVRAVALALAQLGRMPRMDSSEWDRIVAAKLESLLPDAAAVRFVTDTSVPPYVDAELARLLSGNPETAGLLDLLERNGFGRWIPYARNQPVFQYVETIRDTFRAVAAADGERFRRSCVVTAEWMLENEEVVDHALQLAIEGGDYGLADRVFVALVIINPDSYITDRFLAPLRNVPEAALREYPMLAFGLGLALMTNPVLRLEAPRVFRIAVDSPAHPPYLEPSIDGFTHASMRAIARRLALDYPASAEAGREAARLADVIDPVVLERHREHVGTILRQLCFSIWQGGHLDDAAVTANRSVALCARPASRNYSTVYAAAISAFAGDLRQAAALLASIDGNAWPAEMRATSMNGMGLLAEAYLYLDALDFVAAAGVLRHSDPYMRTNEYWPFLTAAWVCARNGLGHGRAEAQRVTAELAAAAAPPGVGDNTATWHLRAVLAQTWMANGDHRAAARLLEGHPVGSPYLAAARTAGLLADGRDRAALKAIHRGLDLPGHTVRTRAEVHVIGAVAALRNDEREQAWTWLSAAAVAWDTSGPRLHLAFLDPRDRRRLREFARERSDDAVLGFLDVPVAASRRGTVAELTDREQVVLTQLAVQGSVRAISQTLSVSPHTVKSQVQSIYRKLGVSSRSAALDAAAELGLIAGGSSR